MLDKRTAGDFKAARLLFPLLRGGAYKLGRPPYISVERDGAHPRLFPHWRRAKICPALGSPLTRGFLRCRKWRDQAGIWPLKASRATHSNLCMAAGRVLLRISWGQARNNDNSGVTVAGANLDPARRAATLGGVSFGVSPPQIC